MAIYTVRWKDSNEPLLKHDSPPPPSSDHGDYTTSHEASNMLSIDQSTMMGANLPPSSPRLFHDSPYVSHPCDGQYIIKQPVLGTRKT